jgi:hypothetical protein
MYPLDPVPQRCGQCAGEVSCRPGKRWRGRIGSCSQVHCFLVPLQHASERYADRFVASRRSVDYILHAIHYALYTTYTVHRTSNTILTVCHTPCTPYTMDYMPTPYTICHTHVGLYIIYTHYIYTIRHTPYTIHHTHYAPYSPYSLYAPYSPYTPYTPYSHYTPCSCRDQK